MHCHAPLHKALYFSLELAGAHVCVWSAVCSDALEFVLWRSAKKSVQLARSVARTYLIIALGARGGRLAAVEAAVLVSLCTR